MTPADKLEAALVDVELPPIDTMDDGPPTLPLEAYRNEEPAAALDDFLAYLPDHRYVFVPTGELWPSSSVNARIAPVRVGKDKTIAPSTWLDQNRAVEQMTWAPGASMIARDRLGVGGGWIDKPGCSVFNLYRPPVQIEGEESRAGPWLDHVRRVYPDEAAHLIAWLAHRVQRPGEKINHAIVMGGGQGIGKDTILAPVKAAVGSWNFSEVSPANLLGRFNGFVKSVILRVNEARDLGDIDRYAFYDHMKTYTAAPPEVIRCDEKNLREYPVLNVCGVIITTNHRTDGIYLPADDRRHFIAWSELTKDDFQPDYWTRLWHWYETGGLGHVTAYLRNVDLSGFDAKAPPPKTATFYDIVDANRAPEDAELADALDALGNPSAVTIENLTTYACEELRTFLQDRRNRRALPHRLESVGYVSVRNDVAADGLWRVLGRRVAVYGRKHDTFADRMRAARLLTAACR